MNKILVICGQTATGKTALALEIAKKHSGELISVDSRQAFKDMTIGTGKDISPEDEFVIDHKLNIGYYLHQNTKIWLYDAVTPDELFSVAHCHNLAWKVIEDCWKRNVLPILVGGDGFYLQGIFTPPESMTIPPNPTLRIELEDKSLQELQQRLLSVNSKRWQEMNNSDRHNPRRLIRAIEIGSSQGKQIHIAKHETLWIGLKMESQLLEQKIRDRVMARINHNFEHEVSQLINRYPSFNKFQASSTPGYQQWLQFLNGEFDKHTAIDRWTKSEINYAKRQWTWFKKRPGIKWFDIKNKSCYAQAISEITSWISYVEPESHHRN